MTGARHRMTRSAARRSRTDRLTVLQWLAVLVPADWERLYGHPIYFLETFIDPARFRGTCYRAANWRVLGRTTGRGHNAPTRRPTRPVKEVLGYALVQDFRARLTRPTP